MDTPTNSPTDVRRLVAKDAQHRPGCHFFALTQLGATKIKSFFMTLYYSLYLIITLDNSYLSTILCPSLDMQKQLLRKQNYVLLYRSTII